MSGGCPASYRAEFSTSAVHACYNGDVMDPNAHFPAICPEGWLLYICNLGVGDNRRTQGFFREHLPAAHPRNSAFRWTIEQNSRASYPLAINNIATKASNDLIRHKKCPRFEAQYHNKGCKIEPLFEAQYLNKGRTSACPF